MKVLLPNELEKVCGGAGGADPSSVLIGLLKKYGGGYTCAVVGCEYHKPGIPMPKPVLY